MTTMKKTNVSSVSWPDKKLKEQAKKRAKALGLSFSSYLNHLIANDLERKGKFTLNEKMNK